MLSQKCREAKVFVFCFLFCLLLILHFGDEVDFSAGFPGSTSWQVWAGTSHPPGCSSYKVLILRLSHHQLTFLGSDLGSLPGWLSGYQLADGPTRPSYSDAQVPIFLGVFRDRSQPNGKTKVFSRRYYTLILAKRPRIFVVFVFFSFLSLVDSSFW